MKVSEIAQEAMSRLNKRITNEVFLIIQQDRKLMREYLKAVKDQGSDTVNRQIGKQVKVRYGLTNMDEREDNPSCTIIQSHQKLE